MLGCLHNSWDESRSAILLNVIQTTRSLENTAPLSSLTVTLSLPLPAGSLASRLHMDVDKMGRSVVLNCNLLLRSTIKSVLILYQMLSLSWQLTLLTMLDMRLLSLIQDRYNTYSKVVGL